MNQFEMLENILQLNGVPFHSTPIYDENNNEGHAIWLAVGHFEFNSEGTLTNVVNW